MSNAFSVKLKFLDDSERIVETSLVETVASFKRVNFADAVSNGKVVRLIFKGQLLRDENRSLESYGVHHNCVIHCHIGSRPYAGASGSRETGAPLHSNPGAFGFDHIPQRPTREWGFFWSNRKSNS